MLGSFHTGITDLYDRLLLAQPDDVFIPKARQDGSYPYYFSETHPWERMLWRGCDFGRCPRRRGVGAEPLSLKNNELPELAPGAPRAASRIFGEVTGSALTFTWSSAHSVLHFAWDKNQSACREPHPRAACFPRASAAQSAWEASVGGGTERQFTIPWLMRGVHGTQNVRLIGLMREPGERMWSAYMFWPQYRRRYGKDANGFVKYVQHVVPAFEACVATVASASDGGGGAAAAVAASAADPQRWLEHCAINFESLSAANEGVYYHADQLLKSLYVAYVPTWLRAFGAERLLLLRAEDYWAAPAPTLRTVSTFLGLPAPTDAQLQAALRMPMHVLHGSNATFWGDKSIINRHVPRPAAAGMKEPGHVASRTAGPMGPEARQLLTRFFAPHNAALARLLGDERFEWADVLRVSR